MYPPPGRGPEPGARAAPGGGGIGLPDGERGRPLPGGGGIGLPDGDIGRPGGGGAPTRAAGRSPVGAPAGRAGRSPGGTVERGRSASTGGRPAGGAGGAGRAATDGAGREPSGGRELIVSWRPLEIIRFSGSAGAGAGARGAGAADWSATAAGAVSAAAGAGSAAGAGATTSAAGAGSTTGAGVSGTWAGAGPSAGDGTLPGAGAAASAEAAAFFVAFLFSGLGSSGWASRIRPSFAARRRTRSAWASMRVDEWLFTSIPIAMVRSTISLFVIPSSLASSCTRMFFGKALFQPFVAAAGAPDLPAAHEVSILPAGCWNASRSSTRSARSTDRRQARSKPPRRTAASKHSSEPVQIHAPRPGAVRSRVGRLAASSAVRVRAATGWARRQPTHVRIGPAGVSSPSSLRRRERRLRWDRPRPRRTTG